MSRRITTLEIKTRLGERKITLLDDCYRDSTSRYHFKCELDHIWESSGMSVIYSKNGCPVCSNNVRQTKETINSYLTSINSKVVLIGDYVNNQTRTKFYCGKCQHQWETTWMSIRNSKHDGCPKCGYHDMRNDKGLTKEKLNVDLSVRQIEMIDDYSHSMKKTKFRCLKCSEVWETRSTDVIHVKNGCPKCAKTGFNPNKPAYCYLIQYDNFMKFGITNNLEKRLRSLKHNGNYTLIASKFYENGQDALNWERKIKNKFGGRFATKVQCPDGFTETLDISLLNEIKSTL